MQNKVQFIEIDNKIHKQQLLEMDNSIEYFSIYSKLRNPSVSPGQKVSTRQHIGTVATDHSEDITELQFQIWKGANPINPSGWISR